VKKEARKCLKTHDFLQIANVGRSLHRGFWGLPWWYGTCKTTTYENVIRKVAPDDPARSMHAA